MRIELPWKRASNYLEVAGSCNGLICLFDAKFPFCCRKVILWNPIIRKFKVLPDSHITFRLTDPSPLVVVGFGCVPRTTECKVIWFTYSIMPSPLVELYTLSTDSWRRINLENVPFTALYKGNSFVKGAVHLVMLKGSESENASILSFDIADEVFGEIELPTSIESVFNYHIATLGESLATFVYSGSNYFCGHWNIWEMKEYGIVESWTKLFTVQVWPFKPLGFMKNGEVILLFHDNRNPAAYDPELHQMKQLEVVMDWLCHDVLTYKESLMLLDKGNDASESSIPI